MELMVLCIRIQPTKPNWNHGQDQIHHVAVLGGHASLCQGGIQQASHLVGPIESVDTQGNDGQQYSHSAAGLFGRVCQLIGTVVNLRHPV